MSEQETDDNPTIDMTSEADQAFMDAESEPGSGHDKVAHYERILERFKENGWDTSRLEPPEGYSGGEEIERSDSSPDYEEADEDP
jgi:hypothetical protein